MGPEAEFCITEPVGVLVLIQRGIGWLKPSGSNRRQLFQRHGSIFLGMQGS